MSKPRKPKGRPVSGWLILDKPVDFGSTEAVSKIKWLYKAQKAGHAGTLDPLASGMLPIALGDATKTVPYVMDGRKIYEFTVSWGEERSTDDLEGEVTQTSEKRPGEEEIRALLPKYTGVIEQVPPRFSAIKITAIVVFMLIGIGVLVSRHQIAGEATGPQLILSHGGLFPGGVLPALMILQGVVFAYAGIELVGVTAGEAKNARDVVPKAVNSIAWRIGVFYIGSVLVLVMLLPWSSYSGNVSPFVTVLDKLGVPGAAGVMNLVVLTAAMSSVNSALYSSSRILRSLAANGSAPKLAGLMGRHGVPYGGVLITAFVYLIGLILNVFVAGEAFEIALNFSALGILGMWGMIMVSHAAMVRKAKRGQLKRPEYRLPLAPFSNYLTIAFLLLVFALSWFDVPAGRTLIYSTPGVLALLVIGWFGVRRRQRKMAAERVANLP